MADAACAIVAGGKASRLDHQVKTLLDIAGRSILDRVLDVVSERFAAVVIAANDDAPYRGRGIPVVADEVPGRGPLAGVHAALRWCRRRYLMVVPGDMPFLDGAVIDLLLSRRAPGVDIVAPFAGGLPEPLLALYSARCLPALERRLAAGLYKASGLVTDAGLNVCRVDEPELRAIDPELRFLANINTRDDLERARGR